MPERLTDEQVALIGASHHTSDTYGYDRCAQDGERWPCDIRRLLDERHADRTALAEARAEVERYQWCISNVREFAYLMGGANLSATAMLRGNILDRCDAALAPQLARPKTSREHLNAMIHQAEDLGLYDLPEVSCEEVTRDGASGMEEPIPESEEGEDEVCTRCWLRGAGPCLRPECPIPFPTVSTEPAP